MRKIKDNLYVFSLSRAELGRIVACRTQSGVGAEGQQLFSYLGISQSEHRFFMDTVVQGDRTCLALAGERDGCGRQILIFDAVADGTGYYVVFELLFPFEWISAVLSRKGFDGVLLSAKTKQAALSQEVTEIPESVYAEMQEYISSLLFRMKGLKAFASNKDAVTEEQLSDAIEAVTELVAVGCRFGHRVLCEERSAAHSNAEIFDRTAVVAVMLLMAMLARRFSVRRELKLTFVLDRDRQALSFEFEGSESAEPGEKLQKLKDKISLNRGLACDVVQKEGLVRFSICPLYADVGLAGIKRFLLQLRYDDAKDDTFSQEEE